MKEDFIQVTKILTSIIKQLSDNQLKKLVDGTGKLVYQDNQIKKEEALKSIPNEYQQQLETLHTIDEASKYLSSLKKKDLIEIAHYYHIRLLKSDTKIKITTKIINLVLGSKFRKQMFEGIKLSNK